MTSIGGLEALAKLTQQHPDRLDYPHQDYRTPTCTRHRQHYELEAGERHG